MLEGALESPLDCGGVCGGSVPQWKRELLQRRALRCASHAPRAPPPPPPPPPPPAPRLPPDDDEELRYGPGIVKKLKSRYLSLALRDAPRRRPSVLRRAASLEHLLEPPVAPPPPPPPHPPRTAALRRECIKRARSVDALTRLERDDTPRPPPPRAPRAPRRPRPLLSDAERPPADVVRAALRKFESAPPRPRPAPAARVSGVLRGLARTPPRSAAAATQTTPSLRTRPPCPAGSEPRSRSPSPATTPALAPAPPDCSPRHVSRAALDGIARAGASVRYSFDSAPPGSHLPALAAANPVLLRARAASAPRQVGVIRPMPVPARAATPPPPAPPAAPPVKCASPPAARRAAPRPAAPAGAMSVVFNFSSRPSVPDYVENDGLVLRAARADRLKAGDPGVVVLEARGDETDGEDEAEAPPSPCRVRFVNDNVLINGRSNLARRPPRAAAAAAPLKLQFDDSLTRTHEYPAEGSAAEEAPAPPAPRPAPGPLASYQPSKMLLQDPASAFQLGVTRAAASPPPPPPPPAHNGAAPDLAEEYLKPCGEAEGRAWSDTRHTDLLF